MNAWHVIAWISWRIAICMFVCTQSQWTDDILPCLCLLFVPAVPFPSRFFDMREVVEMMTPSRIVCQYGAGVFLRWIRIRFVDQLTTVPQQLTTVLLIAGWETKNFWHSPELGSLLYSLYKIPLAQACFPLARPNFHSHWRAGELVSQPVIVSLGRSKE